MISKEDYITQKQQLVVTGQISPTFLQYMYRYYTDTCMQRGIEPKCTEEQFPDYLKRFLAIPVKQPNSPIATQTSPRQAAEATIKHFDKLYNIQ